MVAVVNPVSMLDVEYLLDAAAVSRPIVYRYRTGILVDTVRRALLRTVEKQGGRLLHTDPLDFHEASFGATLFDESIPFCDWPRRKTRAVAKLGPAIVRALAGDDSRPSVFFAHVDDSIFRLPEWSQTNRRWLLLDEAVVSSEVVGVAIDYLFSVTDLPSCPIDRSSVVRHFQVVLEQEGREGFDRFTQRFDTAMLVDCDEETGKFVPPKHTQRPFDRSYIMAPLRRLVESNREAAIDELVANLGIRLRDRAERVVSVVSSLFELTDILIENCTTSDSNSESTSNRDDHRLEAQLALWFSVLLVWSCRLIATLDSTNERLVPRADASVATLAQMARDFRVRANTARQSNPISDLWPEIRHVLRSYSEDDALVGRFRMQNAAVVTLGARLRAGRSNSRRPRWLDELDLLVSTAIEERATRLDGFAP